MRLYVSVSSLIGALLFVNVPFTILGESNTIYKSKSYQNMIIKNGSGEPISEKKMSAFSVEDKKGDDK